MKLKQRLSLYAVILFSILIIGVSAIIYFSFAAVMERKEMQGLESKTLLAALYYLEKDELSIGDHENIKSQLLKKISRKNIAIFDSLYHQVYGDMSPTSDIQRQFIDQIRENNSEHFATKDFFYHGIYYQDNQGNFIVIAREPKTEFKTQLQSLFHILWVASAISILIIFFIARYLSKWAYAPIIKITKQIKNRDAQNFHQPIKVEKTYQELQDLVENYNYLVNRISEIFSVQKNFIDYVSHELKTPISALLGILEVTGQKARSAQEYQIVLQKSKQYVHDLEDALNNMLLLSGANPSFEFTTTRIDEIIWKVIENAVIHHQAKIEVNMAVEDQSMLELKGNAKLLEIALTNIVENAIKYSHNKPIQFKLLIVDQKLHIYIIDRGIGIPEKDLPNITRNFYRAANAKNHRGKGIGLSLANIIFSLHHIGMAIHNEPEGGTRVTLIF